MIGDARQQPPAQEDADSDGAQANTQGAFTMNRVPRSTSIAIVLALSLATTLVLPGNSVADCTVSLPSPFLVPVSGSLSEILIDQTCEHVFVTNTSNNQVEVLSLQSGMLEAAIAVGSAPAGLAMTPDGGTLYVANSGDTTISVVDLAMGVEVRQINVPPGFSNDRPFSIAVANNGLALFSTTFAGSGFGGRMMQLDVASDAVSQRTDFWFFGTTTEITYLKPSGDGSTIAIVAGDISSGPVFTYAAGTDSFSPERDLNSFVSYIASDAPGSTFLVNPGTYVLDSDLNLSGTIFGGGFGVALEGSGTIGYRVVASGIDILDPVSFLTIGSLDLGDTVATASPFNRIGVGRMAISADGSLLAVITDHGVSVVQTTTAVASSANPTEP